MAPKAKKVASAALPLKPNQGSEGQEGGAEGYPQVQEDLHFTLLAAKDAVWTVTV